MKQLFLFTLAILLTVSISAQQHEIKIEIKNTTAEEIYLAHYYGERQYLDDTLQLQKGVATIKGDSLLPQGVYLVVLPSKKFFEILVGEDQEFEVSTSMDDFVRRMKIKGSKENEDFHAYQLFMMEEKMKANALSKKLQSMDPKNDSAQIISNELDAINATIRDKWEEILNEQPNSMIGTIIGAMYTPEIPEFDIPEDAENKDSIQWFKAYNYNKNHYFDYVDFSDSRVLRTPVLPNKLNQYFNKILMQHPDTLIKYIDKTLAATGENQEMFRYLLNYFFDNAQKSNIMGMDKVVVHIADNYYLTSRVDWLGEDMRQKLSTHVSKLRPNLIGNTAPDLKLENSEGFYERLHDIDAKLTMVYFWEPNCGHCKTVTPKMLKLYHQYDRSEFEVLAVYTQTDKEEWMKFIHEKELDWLNVWDPYRTSNFHFLYNVASTPSVYLLDEDKKIIAKSIGFEAVEQILKERLN